MHSEPAQTELLPARYEPPALVPLGTVHELTLARRRCWWGKEFGGHDGYYFLGIPVPISNCSP